MSLSIFDFLNNVNESKIDLMKNDYDGVVEKDYNPYMINRGLSFFPDTILYANEMNRADKLPKKIQYKYYLNSIRKRKRFSKWFKPKNNSDITAIMDYYKYNRIRAEEIIDLLSPDKLKKIKAYLNKGGR